MQRSEITEFVLDNGSIFNEIEERLTELGEKYLNSRQREEILKVLEPYFDYEVPKEEKIKITEWLYKELKLNDRYLHDIQEHLYTAQGDRFDGFRVNSAVSFRQMGTMQSSLTGARKGNVNAAFHEMTDFIDNYQLNLFAPINNFEKVCLKIMCESILALK